MSAPFPAAGEVLAPSVIEVDRATIRAYVAASGDDNPIHLDDDAARALGLPGVIAHGMWTMGAILRVVEQTYPQARVVRAFTRFARPLVLPPVGPTAVRVTGTVSHADDATATLALEASADIDGTQERIAKVEVHLAR